MPFAPEDLQQLIEALKPVIVETASKAAADHVTKRNKSWEDKLDEKLSNFSPKPVQDEPSDEKTTLTQRMVKLEETNKKLLSDLKSEKEQGQRSNMKSVLNQFLIKNKVPEHLVKPLAAQLLHEDKLVDINKNGEPIFRGADEELPLEEGLSFWLKDNGKQFLSTPKVSGTGLKQTKLSPANRQSVDQPSQDEMDELLVQLVREAR